MNPGKYGYEIWWTDDEGKRRVLLDDIISGDFVRVASGVGSFSITAQADKFTVRDLVRDQMVQIWRKPRGGTQSLFRVYFIRRWTFERRGSGLYATVGGPCCNDLLRRRHIINYAGETESTKTDYVDDMMKEIVDEQMVDDDSDPAASYGSRDYADLSVAPDLAAGSSVTRSFPWNNVLDIITSLAEASRAGGTEVFFDIVPIVSSNSIAFTFRTTTGQPGMDITDRMVFDEARGNMHDARLEYDATQEVNYAYAIGLGQETNRNVRQAYDATRINVSQWNRCEGIGYAMLERTDAGGDDVANAKLTEGEPRLTFSAQPMDTTGTRFGVDWNWGDKVTARFLGQDYETVIRRVRLAISDRGELVDARMEYQE